jgi:uncharacterized Tic20 family protein
MPPRSSTLLLGELSGPLPTYSASKKRSPSANIAVKPIVLANHIVVMAISATAIVAIVATVAVKMANVATVVAVTVAVAIAVITAAAIVVVVVIVMLKREDQSDPKLIQRIDRTVFLTLRSLPTTRIIILLP